MISGHMKRFSKVALVGRPNVGKSALFNRLCGKRISIVDAAEGVTRDRIYGTADLFGRTVEMIDTGGIHPQSEVPFQEAIRRQAEIAIEEADAVILVVDSQSGVTALDEFVARLLLRKGKHLVLAVNKIDDMDRLPEIHSFHSLGISTIVGVSAVQGFQIAELLEEAVRPLSPPEKVPATFSIRVAIIGRPNVGKSTLVNTLLDEERCVVSPIAGTTRDSVDVEIEVGGHRYTLVDTAGIRKSKAEHDTIEKFAAIRTERAIENADVCVLMLDAETGMTTHDKKIADHVEKLGKGCILAFNKWDLVKGYRMEHCLKSFAIDNAFLSHCPIVFISAQTGRNLSELFPLIQTVNSNLDQRVSTGQLNKFLERTMQKVHPPMIMGKRLRIYYLAQVGVRPPHFVLFVNNPDLMTEAYRKYLVNSFRESYHFTGVPILFTLRGRKVKKEEGEQEEDGEAEEFEPVDA